VPFQLEIFLDNLLNGLTLGALYALVTIGLALIFGVVRFVNFAHGDFFMVGGYMLFLLLNMPWFSLPYPVIILLVTLLGALFAMLVERLAVQPILDKSWRIHAVATLGISIILENAALIIFSTDPKQVPTPYSTMIVSPLGIRTSVQRLIILAVVVLVFTGLQWFVRTTKPGKAMRAVSQNREMCRVVGVNVRRIALYTFALSGALAGLAAALIAPLLSVTPTMGLLLTLKGLAAIIMGGLGQLNGSVYAAFLLGLVESFFGGYVSFAFKDVVSFGIFILVLFLRPQGFFGKRIGL
jgi:branched-chain amino acid transport system permease protein